MTPHADTLKGKATHLGKVAVQGECTVAKGAFIDPLIPGGAAPAVGALARSVLAGVGACLYSALSIGELARTTPAVESFAVISPRCFKLGKAPS